MFISSAFEEFVEKRCDEALEKNNEMKECSLEFEKLEGILIKNLGQEELEIFKRYEECQIRLQYKTNKILYKQGLSDAAKFLFNNHEYPT